jgi:ribonuclease I
MRNLVLAATLALAPPAHADGERAGDFDYYVLALSWVRGVRAGLLAPGVACAT